MKIPPILALALIGIAAGGCAADRQSPPENGPVRLGQIAAVGGPMVRPLAVIEDSRCPTGVACIWPGRIVVRAEVRGGGWRKTLDLSLGQPQHVADGALTLISATPERRADHQLKPADYRFTFAFAGGL